MGSEFLKIFRLIDTVHQFLQYLPITEFWFDGERVIGRGTLVLITVASTRRDNLKFIENRPVFHFLPCYN